MDRLGYERAGGCGRGKETGKRRPRKWLLVDWPLGGDLSWGKAGWRTRIQNPADRMRVARALRTGRFSIPASRWKSRPSVTETEQGWWGRGIRGFAIDKVVNPRQPSPSVPPGNRRMRARHWPMPSTKRVCLGLSARSCHLGSLYRRPFKCLSSLARRSPLSTLVLVRGFGCRRHGVLSTNQIDTWGKRARPTHHIDRVWNGILTA